MTPIPAPTNTPDPCAGATESGANSRFTFDEIVPCLASPEQVLEFMRNNMRHGGGGWDNEVFGQNAYSPAREVFQSGMDDCDGLAEFAACVLHMNGFEAYNVGISIIGPLGHNVTGFVSRDGSIFAINNGEVIDGPFSSWIDLAEHYIQAGYAEADNIIWLFEPCLEATTIGDAVLSLPHTVVR